MTGGAAGGRGGGAADVGGGGRRRALRATGWVVGVLIAVVVLFTVVFPWVEARHQVPTLDPAGAPPGPGGPAPGA